MARESFETARPGDESVPFSGPWYLAQVRPNQGERAASNLRRQGYDLFAPRRSVTRRRRGKLVTGLAPLFPGYLFVGVAASQEWHPINNTYGVVRLVMRAAHVPQPVPSDVMADLLANTDTDGVLVPATDFTKGEVVRIAAGPMSGFVARVERQDDKGSVGLLLEMMGQAVRAALPAAHLERFAG